MPSSDKKKVAVIGAGVVGLSAALKMLELHGDRLEVTIIADRFLQQTLTYSCGGLWEPYQIAGTPDEEINRWGKVAFDHFRDLSNGPDAGKSGVQLLTAYQLLEKGQDSTPPSWSSIVHNFQVLSNSDLKNLDIPSNYVAGFSFGTYVIEQKYYMHYITNKLKALGAVFEQRLVESIDEFRQSDRFDAVVNCTGLGARELLGDQDMYPVRGQVLRVRAPWMKNIWFFGSSYIIPQLDSVVLGGTAQRGDWNTNVDLADTERIVDNIAKLFPSVRDAPIENAWVGLRPGRTPLRLESETVPRLTTVAPGKELHVVHCYGHGGSGVTLGMGCAHDVVKQHLEPLLGLDAPATAAIDGGKLSSWFSIRSRL